MSQHKKSINRIEFEEIEENPFTGGKQNIDFLSEISMELKIELAKTTKTTKEILTLEEGNIIKLDKIAGENVEVFFNNKYIAKGEVVLVDETYGIRITGFSNKK